MMKNIRAGEKAENLMNKLGLSYEDVIAIRFALNIGLATFIVWTTLRYIHDTNPIWSIASMVAASDPTPKEAGKQVKARLINVLVGGVVGLLFILIGGAKEWLLPLAMIVTVLLSSFLIRVKTNWAQAPITAAFVIASGLLHDGSTITALSYGLHKLYEVVFGCVVGIVVSIVMSKLWLIKKKPEQH
jgi:uncharacterized membrane protein YccC